MINTLKKKKVSYKYIYGRNIFFYAELNYFTQKLHMLIQYRLKSFWKVNSWVCYKILLQKNPTFVTSHAFWKDLEKKFLVLQRNIEYSYRFWNINEFIWIIVRNCHYLLCKMVLTSLIWLIFFKPQVRIKLLVRNVHVIHP